MCRNIKFISQLVVCLAVIFTVSCVQMRSAQTSIGEALDGATVVPYAWGEVYCGRGKVCSEIEVARVDFENRDGGRVEVTLHNRTSISVAAQIALEIVTDKGVRLDSTTYQNVALPPRQEIVWDMPGIYHKGGKVRVLLRERTNRW